jgi:hypothetical protein
MSTQTSMRPEVLDHNEFPKMTIGHTDTMRGDVATKEDTKP